MLTLASGYISDVQFGLLRNDLTCKLNMSHLQQCSTFEDTLTSTEDSYKSPLKRIELIFNAQMWVK